MIAPRTVLKRLAGGFFFSIVGSAAVFGLMLAMNGLSEPPKKPEFDKQTSFEVAPKPDPPDRPDPPPKKKQKSPQPKQTAAPPPQIKSAIGSVGIEMPGFSPSDVEKASKELVGDVEASVMTADSVDEKPKPVRRVDPKLPRRIVAKQLEGKVVVKALVSKKGRVEKVRIIESKPDGVFDTHVVDAVKQWQFQPASYEGKKVKTWIELPFNFELG